MLHVVGCPALKARLPDAVCGSAVKILGACLVQSIQMKFGIQLDWAVTDQKYQSTMGSIRYGVLWTKRLN